MTAIGGPEQLAEYRAAVIATTACSYCIAEPGEQCVIMPEPGARTITVGWAPYVHDDRAAAHHAASMSAVCDRTDHHYAHPVVKAIIGDCPGVGGPVREETNHAD